MPKRRMGFLLGLVLAVSVMGAPTAAAEDPPDNRPDFKLPVPCGQTWVMFTYDGHGPDDGSQESKRIDMQWTEGETKGADILASAGGTVSHVEPGGVHIDHGNGWFTQYLHMSDRAPEGSSVEAGDWIGTASNVGTEDPHLHYQQMYDFDGNGYPTEGNDQGPDELVYPVIQGEEYRLAPGNAVNLKSTNCDGGEPEPEEPKKTELAVHGGGSIANGSPTRLSAVLTDENQEPVVDREVSFTLGSADSGQACKGTTTDEGKASCTIDSVDQPLSAEATVPVTAEFKGDDAYGPSQDSADLKLQYVSGRAYGVSAEAPLQPLPVSIAPHPDTGNVRSADAETEGPSCAESIRAVVLSADALCAGVKTGVGPSTSTATSTVSRATIGLTGLPVVEVSGVTATSTSSCSSTKGATELELNIGGVPVTVPETPNYSIDLGPGAKLVVNEQTSNEEGADEGLTTNALHLTALNGVDIVLASSTSAAHNCA